MKDATSVSIPVLIAVIFHCVLNCARGAYGQGADHYCSTDPSHAAVTISGQTQGSIRTLYPGESHYRNNQKCVWIIDAGAGNRVDIRVVTSKLQWAHSHAICPGKDYVAIKDVSSNASASAGKRDGDHTVLQWCGDTQPQGAISSGRYLRVEFSSDNNNPYQYTGVHMHFQTFSSSECAPSWESGGTESCYKLMDRETDWSSAQRDCNTQASNLASVLSQSEQDFLQQTYGGLEDAAWIGLSDIAYPTRYQWIDGSPYTFNSFSGNHKHNKFFRCVVVHFNSQSWKLKDCDKGNFKPICKARKGSRTSIHPVPQQQTDEKDSEVPTGTIAAVAVSVVALVIILIVILFVYRRKRGQPRKSHRGPSGQGGGEGQAVSLSAHNRPPQPSAPPSEDPVMTSDARMLAPPTYDEALSHPVVTSGDVKGNAMP